MHDRRLAEALVSLPLRQLVQRKVDLQLAPPIAEPLRRLLEAVEQLAVQLRRRDVADHRTLGQQPPPVGCANAAARHTLHAHARLARAALRADVGHQRLRQLRAAAARDRHAALLHRDRDHLRHVARPRRLRAEARMQHPRRQHAMSLRRCERRLQPVARRDQQLPPEVARACTPEPANRLQRESRAVARPQLRAEDPEREVGVREEAREHRPPLLAELRRVTLGRAQQERALSVRERRCRREVRVQVLEPMPCEVVAELRMRRPAYPERMPRAEHVVLEAGRRDLGGLDRAAEPVVPLQDANVPAALRQERRARQAIDPRADDDRVVVSQRLP